MFKDKVNSIAIRLPNDNDWLDISSWLVEVKYGYNKLWSSDSGRNLAGKQSGTLIGIFPKITCQFKRLTKSQMETLARYLDAPKQVVHYYDPRKKAYTSMTTYTGDWENTNKSVVGLNGHKNEGFQISFISVAKR